MLFCFVFCGAALVIIYNRRLEQKYVTIHLIMLSFFPKYSNMFFLTVAFIIKMYTQQ